MHTSELGVKLEAADATINRELAILRRGYSLAKKAGLYRGQPPYLGLFALDNAREGFVEDSDYHKLLEHLPAHLKCLAIVGYHLGMRAGELREIDLGPGGLGESGNPVIDFTNQRKASTNRPRLR